MYKRYIFILIIVFGFQHMLHAQSGNILTQTLTWNSQKGIDVGSTDTLTSEMEFITYGSDKIEHVSPKGFVQTFDINSTSGSWTNVGQSGSMTYQVSINEATGTIVIQRAAGVLSFTLDMTSSSPEGLKRTYFIHTLE